MHFVPTFTSEQEGYPVIWRTTIRIFALSLLSAASYAQIGISPERAALHNIQKKKWDRAEAQLRKALRKDSLDATTSFVLSRYFFTADNPRFQVDSSYHYVKKSIRAFHATTAKERDRLRRFPLDSIILIRLRSQIDSAAFERAKDLNTEASYIRFLADFSFAAQQNQAIELRDEVAYLDALKVNTYVAFHNYFTKYPNSLRAPEAHRRYEKLLYEVMTKDKRLHSFEVFLRQYPNTPYRRDAERQIFEIVTASGEPATFAGFVDAYPQSLFAGRARNILYHIIAENDDLWMAQGFWTDSIRAVQRMEHEYLVPFLKDGRFGFMDSDGRERIKPIAFTLDNAYRCGNIHEDVIALDSLIISRNGSLVYAGHVEEIEDIGAGFLAVGDGSCTHVVHKSGFKVGECMEDVKVLSERLIAMRSDEGWGLYSFSGRMLISPTWDEISSVGNVFLFTRKGQTQLALLADIAAAADQKVIRFSDEFDEAKSWPGNFVFIRIGNKQGLLDGSLHEVVKPDNQVISLTPAGTICKSPIGVHIVNNDGQDSPLFSAVSSNAWWTAVKKESWTLYNEATHQIISPAYDSIKFTGPFAIGMKEDSMRVYFTLSQYKNFSRQLRTEFIPGKDSTSFLLIDEGEKKSIYSVKGQKLFTAPFDKVMYAGGGVFIVTKKEKKGLVGLDGKIILPLEFDAIGSANNGGISLLRSMRFGMYDVSTRKQIKPAFDKNLTPYGEDYIVAFKDGAYGFIGWDSKPHGKFEFAEVRYWNDTTALVKKNMQWMFYAIATDKIVVDQITNYKNVLESAEEKIIIFRQDNSYGVLSNVRGEIIPASFTNIVNIGAAEDPLYFTEKHVEEAGIFVVIYYDKNGKLLRRQVFEEDDYDRLYCPGN